MATVNQRAYRYIGVNEVAPPITIEVSGSKLSVSEGDIVDDPLLELDPRFSPCLNPKWVEPEDEKKSARSKKKAEGE